MTEINLTPENIWPEWFECPNCQHGIDLDEYKDRPPQVGPALSIGLLIGLVVGVLVGWQFLTNPIDPPGFSVDDIYLDDRGFLCARGRMGWHEDAMDDTWERCQPPQASETNDNIYWWSYPCRTEPDTSEVVC